MTKRTNTAKWMEKQNRWQIKVQKDGVRKTFYSFKKGRTGQREANKKADQWLNSGIINEKIRVKELYKAYIEEKALNVSRSRRDNIASMFNQYINKMIGRKMVCNVTEQDLQDILNEQYKNGNSHSRIRETRIVLNDFMKYARKNNLTNLVPENLYINKNAPKPQRNALQPSDLMVMFSSNKTKMFGMVVDDEYIDYYRFAVLTGLRRGELLGLKWKDVKQSTLTIKRALNDYHELTQGKTANATRIVPLTSFAMDILVKRSAASHTEEDFIFPIYKPYTLTRRFKAYAEHNGLSCHKFHELRHTFISFTDNDVPINTLKNVVGHSKKMDTIGTYGHLMDGELEEARQVIESKFLPIINTSSM